MQENDLWNRDRFQPWGWCTVENPGLGISSQLGQIVQVLTGHRTQAHSCPSFPCLLHCHPSIPSFQDVLASINILQSSPEGSVPVVRGCPPLLSPLLVTVFGGQDNSLSPVHCGKRGWGEGRRKERPKGVFTEQSNGMEQQQMRRAEERNW